MLYVAESLCRKNTCAAFPKMEYEGKRQRWYDLEWYIKKGVVLDLHHFLLRAQDTGDWTEDTITRDQLIQLLKAKIDTVSFDGIQEDIVKFIPDASVLDIWSTQYFKDLVDKINIK